jgi:hypothetical protein
MRAPPPSLSLSPPTLSTRRVERVVLIVLRCTCVCVDAIVAASHYHDCSLEASKRTNCSGSRVLYLLLRFPPRWRRTIKGASKERTSVHHANHGLCHGTDDVTQPGRGEQRTAVRTGREHGMVLILRPQGSPIEEVSDRTCTLTVPPTTYALTVTPTTHAIYSHACVPSPEVV